jgi:hypothetical protein
MGRFAVVAPSVFMLAVALAAPAPAAPVVYDPQASLRVYDSGGFLSGTNNGDFILAGVEYDAASAGVVVSASRTSNFAVRLIRSTGPGTAAALGAPFTTQDLTLFHDLTSGPDDRYYLAAGTEVIGADRAGVRPVVRYGGLGPSLASTGLTFAGDPSSAVVSAGENFSRDRTPSGLYRRPLSSAAPTRLVGRGTAPAGLPVAISDHVVTSDGRVIGAGMNGTSLQLFDVTGGAGNVSMLISVNARVAPENVRAAVDPVSGDIFCGLYDHAEGYIYRVRPDGSAATLLASGIGVRDLDFAPANPAAPLESRLFVSAFEGGPQGDRIYEITLVPEPAAPLFLVVGGAFAVVRRRARRSGH